jgi:anti-sigma-K factor RskA
MTPSLMTHDEALELAGLYALDALTSDEKAEVDAHVAACELDHSEIESLGGVTPALASLVEPVGAPASVKRRVMDAYAADHPRNETFPDRQVQAAPANVPAATRRWQAPNWMGWAAAGMAVLLLAVLGVAGLNLKSQADLANQRADEMAAAVAAMTAPGSQVAVLHGSGAATGINGFVAIPSGGTGYMVMTEVPPVPAGKTYQAWYIVDGQPASAGTMSAGSDGNVVASGMQPLPGTSVIAVTVEPAGGSAQPTSDPIIVGTLTTAS